MPCSQRRDCRDARFDRLRRPFLPRLPLTGATGLAAPAGCGGCPARRGRRPVREGPAAGCGAARSDAPRGCGRCERASICGTDPRVVLLAVPELEEEILACAEAGVAGYVTRNGSLEDLVVAIDSVGRGEVICSARVAGALMRRVAALASERRGLPGHEPLTSRELDVAALLEAGFSNKEIAGRLCIEVTTVKHHVHNILEKLCVSRRGEAAVKLRDAAGQRLPQISIKS